MGGGNSHEMVAASMYEITPRHQCLLPDVGIDESLQKYSGLDSNAQLQAFSDMQVGIVPGYITNMGLAMAAISSVPNAVGLGALVISFMVELIIKGRPQSDHTYDMLRRVFGEEKAYAVRDSISEYVGRHHTFIGNEERLREELRRLEAQLYSHLIRLRNSVMNDGQMSTRNFKIWVNGAAFHVQMLIHEARLDVQRGKQPSDYTNQITASINLYLADLDRLIGKFREYDSGNSIIYTQVNCNRYCQRLCHILNSEQNCDVIFHMLGNDDPCNNAVRAAFQNLVFSRHQPLLTLKDHFINIRSNLASLINQHDSFSLPPAA